MRAISRRVQRLERTRTASVGSTIRYVLTIAGTDQEVPPSRVEKPRRQDIKDDELDRFGNRFPDTVVMPFVTAI